MAGHTSALVTGARGKVGAAVLAALADNGFVGAGNQALAGVSRSGGDLSAVARVANFGDRDGLRQALAGVDRAFLMVPFGGSMRDHGRNFIDCAKDSGVRFVVRLSGLAAGPDSASAMGRLQSEVDAQLIASGIDYCILRCNSFMQNFSGIYQPMVSRGRLALAQGEGRIAFIDTRDIGRAAANILHNPEPYAGKVLDLNGPELLNNAQVAAQISAATGRDIDYVPISEERARAGYQKAGLPDWEVEVFTSLDRFLAVGGGEGSPDTLARVLGRAPRSFGDFCRDYRASWL
ncbi:NAD(P)H-binding protein [Parahaliea maris]|uniref:NAD(P)H-binding protein n=1 Tax=Parahaliea maris TaxID=2716870 RepID=A0A5C8ZLR4_9GAMM|nr:NmrA family NAD(P)-binding protein [Parahaliea maris]TXS89516.1 NAD(P)H-binding protein [Parahaliea maris]